MSQNRLEGGPVKKKKGSFRKRTEGIRYIPYVWPLRFRNLLQLFQDTKNRVSIDGKVRTPGPISFTDIDGTTGCGHLSP